MDKIIEIEKTELELMQQAYEDFYLICRKHRQCSDCPLYAGKGCACSLRNLSSDFFINKNRGEK